MLRLKSILRAFALLDIQVAALEGSKAELARKLAEAEAQLQTRSVTAADPPLELQRAVTAALAERDGTRSTCLLAPECLRRPLPS